MAVPHTKPGVTISLRPLGKAIPITKTHSSFKTDVMEAIRLALPAGKQISEHKAPGEITVQCLEGRIQFSVDGASQERKAGGLLYLNAAQPHAVSAIDDSTVLVTILLKKAN